MEADTALHPVLGYGVVILGLLLLVSVPTLVVLGAAALRGIAWEYPLWQVLLYSLLVTPGVMVVSGALGLPVKVLVALLGGGRRAADVVTGVLDTLLAWAAYSLLVEDLSSAFVLALATACVWMAVKVWIDGLDVPEG